MSDALWLALALLLVLEGMLPFAAPALWRQAMLRLAQLPDAQLRVFGLVAMAAGLLGVLLLRH
ncbi:DUF2065 domain-containing protein [Cupriavidus sp. USMAA2-4]|uniref:DUF2065 domain-containing protein n=1 Tax=Cupriavidus sp. USMAA2-4 TaxID=876364 RepID=UPI0008A6BB00|nr:DUF2065 domain-containing protein [Cupriavidus sp. USMAA2-4]AOY93525.1 DUF2065 domain-containing protein [Cupriavidus sp. USMAA2-4]